MEGQFDLHAAFRYVNLHLLKDGDFEKEITVYIGKRPLKVLPLDDVKITADKESLRMEGVRLEWPDQA